MSRQRRPLSVQPLETRKLMAGDALGGGIFNDGTVNVSQATDEEIIKALNDRTQITSNPVNDAGQEGGGLWNSTAAATDAVMARYQRINS